MRIKIKSTMYMYNNSRGCLAVKRPEDFIVQLVFGLRGCLVLKKITIDNPAKKEDKFVINRTQLM